MKQTDSSIIIVRNVFVCKTQFFPVEIVSGGKNLILNVWTIFLLGAIILMWYTRNVILLASDILFINWTVRMSDNLPERVQILGHTQIIYITVRENTTSAVILTKINCITLKIRSKADFKSKSQNIWQQKLCFPVQ
jgi:hypothetical protein